MADQDHQGRPLGHFERFCLARTNAGLPQILAFVAPLPDRLSPVVLHRSVAALLAAYPLLRSAIAGRTTRTPTFVPAPITPHQVVRIASQDAELPTTAALLVAALQEGTELDVADGPLWRVVLHESSAGDRLVLVLNHLVTDGHGAKALLAQLLELLRSSDPPATPLLNDVYPPTLEETVDVRPSVRHVAGVIASELLLPLLPAFLRPTPRPAFPGPPARRPSDCPTKMHIFSFPLATVVALKAVGKSHSVATLHPLLHTCAVAALALSTTPSLLLHTQSPISLRLSPHPHPTTTGNYVSSLSTSLLLDPLAQFWTLATAYASLLQSPSALKTAKEYLGMLAWISDPALPEGALETGWEVWIKGKQDQKEPFRDGIELSNLGVFEGHQDVVWAQAASPIGAAVVLNLISANGGNLNVSAVWRDGALDNRMVDQFCAAFEDVVERVARGAVGDDARFKDLAG